ncbi:MAG: class I SAM-dependent methyltransferase [Bacillota bacterium]|nr:class I SAM-dependent methyltransferase [Bacillota bacterium]
MSRVRLYDEPRYYDIAFGWDISPEADFLERVFSDLAAHEVRSVLDLACGTGRFALELARRGYLAAGLDLSRDMLSYARQKAVEHGLSVELFLKDMSDFALYRTFDAAICMTGSIYYLHTIESLVEHLRRVATHLVQGGLYVMDVPLALPDSGVPPVQEWTAERDRVRVATRWELLGPPDPDTGLATERLTLRGFERGWERVWEQEATVHLLRPQDLQAAVDASRHFRLAAMYREFDVESRQDGPPAGHRVIVVLVRTTAPEPLPPRDESADRYPPRGRDGAGRRPGREGGDRRTGGRGPRRPEQGAGRDRTRDSSSASPQRPSRPARPPRPPAPQAPVDATPEGPVAQASAAPPAGNAPKRRRRRGGRGRRGAGPQPPQGAAQQDPGAPPKPPRGAGDPLA